MADTYIVINGFRVLLVDNEDADGTYSISTSGGGVGGGGDASAANQDEQTALLVTIDSDTNALATVISPLALAQDGVVGGTQAGIASLFKRNDALEALTPIEGDAVVGQVDANGAIWVQIAGALSSLVDTVGVGLPPGATAIAPINKRYTTAQTGVDVWDPTLARFNVQWMWVTWSGALACRITIWQGANADTTFTQDTDLILFDMDLDANANGGVYLPFPIHTPWKSNANDHEVHITTSAAKIVSLGMGGYETAT